MVEEKKIPVKLPPFTASIQFMKSAQSQDWSHEFYNIQGLHALGKKGKGVKVAVVDTGVDLNHNSFQSAIAQGRLTAVDARKGKNQPIDKNGHGTWCVSRYISDGNDVLGFAPECTVTSYKVLNDNGSGTLTDVLRGIKTAIEDGHHIISTSLGWSGGSQPNFKGYVKRAKEEGILWFSAAGNDGTREDIDYPALYADIFSVGSHDRNRKRSSFSDFGVDLDVYSSGEEVLGAFTNNREAFLNGTSMATPSFGALIATIYFDLIDKYGVISREVLKTLVTC